ncbi:MAG: PDZ domain-containing protein [Planctomycetota bacterium]
MPIKRMIQCLTVVGLVAVLSNSVLAQKPDEVFHQQQQLIKKLKEAAAAKKESQKELMQTQVVPLPLIQVPEQVQPNAAGLDQESSWPGRLHVSVDFLRHRDVVRVLLKDVMPGGVADSMGLRPGDLIVGVNYRLIRSESEFRRLVLGQVAPVFHVRSPNGHVRVVKYTPVVPVVYFAGVNGHLDERQEFIVDYIAPHDELTIHLGLRRGDKILAAGGQPIHGIAQLMSIVKPNQGKMAIVLLRYGQIEPEVVWINL